MIVMKFGGTSVAGAAPMRQAAQIVRRFVRRRPVVVVSALAGVTDDLIAISRAAALGRTVVVRRLMTRVRRRHVETARALGIRNGGLDDLFTELEQVVHGITLLREPGARSLDLVMSFGERLSARLFAAYLVRAGLPARDVDAREVIVTDDTH